MPELQSIELWRRAFEPQEQDDDEERDARSRLREAYLRTRENARIVLGEIAVHLPHFTVHDISHADALWEYAGLIVGPRHVLNPVEAFVLGVAFLVHDAGMALPAIGGIERLQADEPYWRAQIREAWLQTTGREPEEREILVPSEEVRDAAISAILREKHAAEAENLVTREWIWDSQRCTLVEDADLREDLGPSIGRVAAYHGDPISTVDSMFGDMALIASPTSLPSKWTCDLLKIALLLRTADAAHLDDRRAPRFLAALRRPRRLSLAHWKFQERLGRPIFVERLNVLRYQTKRDFTADETDAWWLAYDTAREVNHELAAADALLRDRRTEQDRFQARGVQNVGSSSQFAECVRVTGWRPIDAAVRIEDPTVIIRRLAGEQLYGDDLTVPLRELLQNAADAVAARRRLENDPRFGRVEVALEPQEKGWRLTVSDDGVGMDEGVLTKYLLNFGKSFWSSPAAWKKFPELASSDYRAVGKFGIGFFSVFMLGTSVRVTTRQYDAGAEAFRTLRFANGLTARPVLQETSQGDRPRKFNTVVAVDLDEQTTSRLLQSSERYSYGLSGKPLDEVIFVLLTRLAAAFPVDLFLKTSASEERKVLGADDWIDLDGLALFERINGDNAAVSDHQWRWVFDAIQPIYFADGTATRLAGRLGLFPAAFAICENLLTANRYCAILAGPFPAARIGNLAGMIKGEPTRAARDQAIVDTTKLDWEAWVRVQCDIMAEHFETASFADQARTTDLLLQLGGLPRKLQCLLTDAGPLTLNSAGTWIDGRDAFTLHLINGIPTGENTTDKDVAFGLISTSPEIPAVFVGIPPKSLAEAVAEICQERWGSTKVTCEQLSAGSWQYNRSRTPSITSANKSERARND